MNILNFSIIIMSFDVKHKTQKNKEVNSLHIMDTYSYDEWKRSFIPIPFIWILAPHSLTCRACFSTAHGRSVIYISIFGGFVFLRKLNHYLLLTSAFSLGHLFSLVNSIIYNVLNCLGPYTSSGKMAAVTVSVLQRNPSYPLPAQPPIKR